MRKLYTILLLSCVYIACKNMPVKPSASTDSNKQGNVKINAPSRSAETNRPLLQRTKRYALDTVLPMLRPSEKLFRSEASEPGEFEIYVRNVSGRTIALINVYDSATYLFEQVNTQWIQKDSFLLGAYMQSLKFADVNGDNRKDIVLGTEGGHGDAVNKILLADKNGNSHYHNYGRIFNVFFDKKTRLLRSNYEGSNSTNGKDTYRWQGDSLIFVRGVNQLINFNGPSKLEFYRNENGKRTKYRQTDDTSGKIYDTAIFKGRYYNYK
jgi:hypothetical protein